MKRKLYLDIDETIIESIEAVLIVLNKRYNTDFKVSDILKWNFSNCFPNITSAEIESVFDSDEFFEIVKFKPYAEELLLKYPTAKFVTRGNKENLFKKRCWIISKGFGHLEYIGLIGSLTDKSEIDMSDSVMVDDNQDNLFSCNAKYKILIVNNKNAEWNNKFVADDKYNFIVHNLQELDEILEKLLLWVYNI